jgi:hypothetical protein
MTLKQTVRTRILDHTEIQMNLKRGKNVKESRNRPGVAQRVPRVLGSQISMTFGT